MALINSLAHEFLTRPARKATVDGTSHLLVFQSRLQPLAQAAHINSNLAF